MKWAFAVLNLIAGLGCSFSSGQVVKQIEPGSEPFGIVDCFGQGSVSASNVRGIIVDPTGVPVPRAVVLLQKEGELPRQATSDNNGQFSIPAPAGDYIFKVSIEPFAGPEIGVKIGRDVVGMFHSTQLYVLLGLPGSFCPWVVTNNKKFKQAIDSNKRMLKEHTKKNATQK